MKKIYSKPDALLWDDPATVGSPADLAALVATPHITELGPIKDPSFESEMSRRIALEGDFIHRFITKGVLPAVAAVVPLVDENGEQKGDKTTVITRFLTPAEIHADVTASVDRATRDDAPARFSSRYDPWDALTKLFARQASIPGAAPLGQVVINDVTLNPGLIPITGPAKIGKSRLLRHYKDEYGIPLLEVNEPRSPRDPVPGVNDYFRCESYTAAFSHVIAMAAILRLKAIAPWVADDPGWDSPRATASVPAISIDSLREFIWTIPGSLGSRGLPNLLGAALTRLSNLFADLGITVLGAINPSYKDAEFGARFDDVVTESVAAFIKVGSVADAATNLVIEQRPERVPTLFGSIPRPSSESAEGSIEALVTSTPPADHIPHDSMTITFDQEL